MNKTVIFIIGLSICIIGHGQTDTISENIYQSGGNLGIGTIPDIHLLNLQSDISMGLERNLLKLNNLSNANSSYTGIILNTGAGETQSVIQDYGINYTASPHYEFGGFLNLSNNSKGLMLHANSPAGIIKFFTGHDVTAGAGIERMRIDSAGNIGIGTEEPQATLHIADGDIFISDIEKGIIMKSPDGNCWRGLLNNSGQLVFSKIDCPGAEPLSGPQSFQASGNVIIYPNPSNTGVTVQHPYSKTIEYQIYNINGQIQDLGSIKSNNQVIDLSYLPAGTYLLNLYDNQGNQLVSKKIVKE